MNDPGNTQGNADTTVCGVFGRYLIPKMRKLVPVWEAENSALAARRRVEMESEIRLLPKEERREALEQAFRE